jgi:hypothetical protein
MPDTQEEVYELTDMEVKVVGLVRKGANQAPIFLMKSEEVEAMSEELEVLENEAQAEETTDDPVVTESMLERMLAPFRKAQEPEAEEEPTVEEVDEEEEVVEKADVEERLVELEKAAKEKDDIIKSLQGEVTEQAKRARVAELEETAKSIPDFDAEGLWSLEQQVGDGFEKVLTAMIAKSEQEGTSELFKEAGVPGTEAAESAVTEVERRAKELETEKAIQYGEAITEVLKSDESLAERFYAERRGG